MSQDIPKDSPDLWIRNMRSGNFEEAWKFSDEVLRSRTGIPCWHLPRHFQYIWDGSPLNDDRVLVRCYHGLGDTIQFIRYAALLKSIAREVTVWVQPSLIPLLQNTSGIDHLLPLHDGTPEAEYDADVEIMELPHIFRTTLSTIPSQIPYLHIEPVPLPREKSQLAVGLVWRAGDWDDRRSIPFSLLEPLANIKNVQLFILQASAETYGWREGLGIHLCGPSLYDDARVIRSLDLLITVDTMTAHLAGALGVPVWTLLAAEADWRWMENREDSPWYPTMKLFRQQQPGDWKEVINRVMLELVRLL